MKEKILEPLVVGGLNGSPGRRLVNIKEIFTA
jgi:hypothetical protein